MVIGFSYGAKRYFQQYFSDLVAVSLYMGQRTYTNMSGHTPQYRIWIMQMYVIEWKNPNLRGHSKHRHTNKTYTCRHFGSFNVATMTWLTATKYLCHK